MVIYLFLSDYCFTFLQDKQAEKPATASDLQGFWEMIYFQVNRHLHV